MISKTPSFDQDAASSRAEDVILCTMTGERKISTEKVPLLRVKFFSPIVRSPNTRMCGCELARTFTSSNTRMYGPGHDHCTITRSSILEHVVARGDVHLLRDYVIAY